MGEFVRDYTKARELLATKFSGFPVDVLGALHAYIDASEAFFANPSLD